MTKKSSVAVPVSNVPALSDLHTCVDMLNDIEYSLLGASEIFTDLWQRACTYLPASYIENFDSVSMIVQKLLDGSRAQIKAVSERVHEINRAS